MQKASKDKDIVDVALVPARIGKPDLRVVPRAPETEAEPEVAEIAEPATAPEPVAQAPEAPASGKPANAADERLKKALARLESLKGRWDDFDAE